MCVDVSSVASSELNTESCISPPLSSIALCKLSWLKSSIIKINGFSTFEKNFFLPKFTIGYNLKNIYFFLKLQKLFQLNTSWQQYKRNFSHMLVEIIANTGLGQHGLLSSTQESSEDPARDGGIINTESLPCLIEACSPRPWSSARELIKTPAENPDRPLLVGTTTRDCSSFPTSSLTIHSLGSEDCEGSSAR